ncbi:MAG: hypothetical protein A3K76_02230 [Euryarchaeota archaeon RBG_13_57_23]|nr:MAG: hypothetical protein A3K76_02230 [Euryarchaeota archaeon RBG_13_57_23]
MLKMYALNRNELRVFEAICEGAESTADLAEALDISTISVYRSVNSLSSKKLVDRRRTGKRLQLAISPHGHSRALCAYLEGSRRPIDPIVGTRLLVLLSVSSNSKDIERVAEEVRLSSESVRRIVWALKGFGAISQEKRVIAVPKSDTLLTRFSLDFSKGACEAMLESISPTGRVLWSEGLQFIFSARSPVETRGVSETGITAMSKMGLPFMSDARYYHYAYWRPRLRREDIALHQILADPSSTRNISYGLLHLMKEGHNAAYLARLGDALGARELTDQIVDFLRRGTVENPHFPSKADMTELSAQYGVS